MNNVIQRKGMVVLMPVCICFMLLYTTGAFGCECKAESPDRAIGRLRKTATEIFVGTVTDVKREVKDFHIGYWATFKVKQSWKTNEIDQVTVFTEGGCMAWFEAGRTYLVYASPDQANRLSTNICMRTRLLKYAREDLKRLGKPRFSADKLAATCAKKIGARPAICAIPYDGEGRRIKQVIGRNRNQGLACNSAIQFPGSLYRNFRELLSIQENLHPCKFLALTRT